jgi:hypothetical protein
LAGCNPNLLADESVTKAAGMGESLDSYAMTERIRKRREADEPRCLSGSIARFRENAARANSGSTSSSIDTSEEPLEEGSAFHRGFPSERDRGREAA